MTLDPNGCTSGYRTSTTPTTGLNDQTRIGSFHFPGCTPVGNGTLSGTVTDRRRARSAARPSRSGSRTTTTDGSGRYSFTVPAGTYPSLTASKPGFTRPRRRRSSSRTAGTTTQNFALSAAAQSGCFTDNSQSDFQRGVPANCDLIDEPGQRRAREPGQHGREEHDRQPDRLRLHATRAGPARRSRRRSPVS